MVVFHAVIPHCHKEDAHANDHVAHTNHHDCDGHHHDENNETTPYHPVCESNDLHGNYIKSSVQGFSFLSLAAIFVHVACSYVITEETESVIRYFNPDVSLVRSCFSEAHILRGPPAC